MWGSVPVGDTRTCRKRPLPWLQRAARRVLAIVAMALDPRIRDVLTTPVVSVAPNDLARAGRVAAQ